MNAYWDDILLAYLHDPPDKALSIRGHLARARDNARVALGDDELSTRLIEDNVTEADPMAAVAERQPMPNVGEGGSRAVAPAAGSLRVIHPLSGVSVDERVPDLTEGLIEEQRECLRRIVRDPLTERPYDARNRFFAVWRLWPDVLADNVDPCFARLPADTRNPDHSIWNHLDIAAAFKAALADGSGAALLAFALEPVQPFIEASRSVRDLWSGSMILSWLAFRGMLPVIERHGPTALVYPVLRKNPLMDLWLRGAGGLEGLIPLPETARRLTPSLPHRFLAVVPWGEGGSRARELAAECERAVARAWKRIADAVRERLKTALDSWSPGWDRRWDDQVASYFRASAVVVPLSGSREEVDGRLAGLLGGSGSFGEVFKDAEKVRELARAIPAAEAPGYAQDHAGRWQYHLELAGRSLAARRAIRPVPICGPGNRPGTRCPPKCTLLGTFEQMGPDDLAASNAFWERAADSANGLSVEGVRIRKGEALCAVAMVKRFAGPAFLAKELSVEPAQLRFPDTWTVAAAEWLNRAEVDPEKIRRTHGDWNGNWLHAETEQDDPASPRCPTEVLGAIKEARRRVGEPPVYYAVLKVDGDDLGGWLRGEKSPEVRMVMHPELVGYFERLGEAARAGLDARRPVGPALHAAIGTALANFALHAVPEIVRRYHGTTIYCGGDDALVLLPVGGALRCALELREAYSSDWWRSGESGIDRNTGREHMMMGTRATLSGGLVFVHAGDDLRLALQDARRAEKQAKESGKDALAIFVRRRSGGHTLASCPWEFVKTVEGWREAFVAGASSRWAYRLYAERFTLETLPEEAIRAEIRRQLRRAQSPTSELLPPDRLVAALDELRGARRGAASGSGGHPSSSDGVLSAFLILCLTASFMARGSDR